MERKNMRSHSWIILCPLLNKKLKKKAPEFFKGMEEKVFSWSSVQKTGNGKPKGA